MDTLSEASAQLLTQSLLIADLNQCITKLETKLEQEKDYE